MKIIFTFSPQCKQIEAVWVESQRYWAGNTSHSPVCERGGGGSASGLLRWSLSSHTAAPTERGDFCATGECKDRTLPIGQREHTVYPTNRTCPPAPYRDMGRWGVLCIYANALMQCDVSQSHRNFLQVIHTFPHQHVGTCSVLQYTFQSQNQAPHTCEITAKQVLRNRGSFSLPAVVTYVVHSKAATVFLPNLPTISIYIIKVVQLGVI